MPRTYRRKRRVARKGKGKLALSKNQVKAVKAIVKKTALKSEETKFFYYDQTGIYPTNNSFISFNLFYHGVNQGTSNTRFLGNELIWRGLSVHYEVINQVTGGAVNDQPFDLQMMIISTPVYKAVTNLAVTDIADGEANTGSRFWCDPDSKIHFKKKIKFSVDRYNAGNTTTQKVMKGSFYFRGGNKKIVYKNFTANYELKDRNYYLVLFPNSVLQPVSAGTQVCRVDFSYKNYFKDA